jgi:hypothetical protein
MSYQRCLTCGTDEYSGAYCTYCRTCTYDLIEHRHFDVGHGSSRECPLGPVFNPGPAQAAGHAIAALKVNRAYLADPIPAGAEAYVIRRWTHHASTLPRAVERPGSVTNVPNVQTPTEAA